MQIRHLQRPIYRAARLASRLETKARSDAVERRDALARWHQARRDGLTAKMAARAVGRPLATLYRWQKRLSARSTRPHTFRKPRRIQNWSPPSSACAGNTRCGAKTSAHR